MTSDTAAPSIAHDLEWLRLIEEKFKSKPVTDDFGTAYFTCAAKLETRLHELLALISELATARQATREVAADATKTCEGLEAELVVVRRQLEERTKALKEIAAYEDDCIHRRMARAVLDARTVEHKASS